MSDTIKGRTSLIHKNIQKELFPSEYKILYSLGIARLQLQLLLLSQVSRRRESKQQSAVLACHQNWRRASRLRDPGLAAPAVHPNLALPHHPVRQDQAGVERGWKWRRQNKLSLQCNVEHHADNTRTHGETGAMNTTALRAQFHTLFTHAHNSILVVWRLRIKAAISEKIKS